MIDFYSYTTSNGQRVAIALEEAALDYRITRINLARGEHKQADFLALNPRGTIPVLVDPDGPGGQSITLSQTFSILSYIARKSGRLLPEDPVELSHCMEWCSFFLTDVGSASMQSFYLRVLAKEKHPEASKVLTRRALNFLQYADQQLSRTPYFAGDDYSLADVIAFPSILSLQDGSYQGSYLHINRWMLTLRERPALQMALMRLSS